jgi:tetratricopeptide (TPR) repeat protein
MTDQRKVETGGGDYREVNNSGQYAERDIRNDRQQQGIIGNDNSIINIEKSEQHFYAGSKPLDRTSDEPPNNLESRGIDRDRFVGRDAVLADLHARLQRSERVAIASVAGMGGVGKSELAVQYGRRHLSETYRGGVVWLAGERAGFELLSFARSTFFPMVDFSQFGDLREQLAFCWAHWPAIEVPPESVLLIFDDVTDYAVQVKPYLPSDGRFRAIVTTRERLQGIDRLDLDVLDPAAALALLRGIVGDRVETEADTAAAICEWLGFLPLGLELVGYYLNSKPDLSLAEMLERLKDKRIEARSLNPKRLPVNLTAQRGVLAAFELSWDQLDEEAQELAMRLSIFAAAPIPWVLVRGCWPEADEEDLEEWRDEELVRLHLLDRVSEGRYGLHPLIREFFAVKLAARSEATDWRRSFARVMTAIAQQIPQTVTISQQAALKEAIAHLAAATEYSDLLSDEDYEWGWPFIGLARFYQAQSLFSEAETYYQQCLDRSETRFGADHPDTATSLNNLAALYRSQGKYESAEPLFQRALDIKERQLGADHPSTATSLNNLAFLYESQGKYKSAEPMYQRALDIRERQLGANHPDTAQSLNNLAALYNSQGKYESAEPLYQRALDIRERQLGADHPSTATSLNNLAALYNSQGKYESAEPLYQRALDIKERQLGADHPSTALSFGNLAQLHTQQKRYADAEIGLLKALQIFMSAFNNPQHPYVTETVRRIQNLVAAAINDGRTAELSDHPLTQQLLAQLRTNER